MTVDLIWRVSIGSTFEGDREGVACGNPPGHLACLTRPVGSRAGSRSRDTSSAAGVSGCFEDSIAFHRADDPTDWGVIVQERDGLAPLLRPDFADRGITDRPLLHEVLEPLASYDLVRGSIVGIQVAARSGPTTSSKHT